MLDRDLEAFLREVPKSNFVKRLLNSYLALEGDPIRARARILRDIEYFEDSAVPERAVILKAALHQLADQEPRS